MNRHYTSPTNPCHVISAERYRLSHIDYVTPDLPKFDAMVEFLNFSDTNLHTRPEGYGLILLEAEEHSLAYFGPIEQVRQYQADNAAGAATTFDHTQGVMIGGWPQGVAWDGFIPTTYWNRKANGAVDDGIGILTRFDHPVTPGAEVIVYEFEGGWLADRPTHKLVTYHCTACHLDTFTDSGHVHENDGPDTRRWAARQARQHMESAKKHGVNRDGQSACRPNNGEMLRIVNEMAKKRRYEHAPLPDTDDAYCAIHGPCSIIRELRAGVRPAAAYA
ncbi:hypothetical protein [Streptomyces nanshensis]|uniref:Uncharacterized protein n=1 Tax=Streptomyces nanshensis TaxID=518642 RepID=A0A1E7L2G0_9ACTN|nr:hypothetical protein [Streptomyces nanshensis]OEV10223.1 hypothetical protein AN218_18565 [Streptomyces nanshensis]